ncbi:hypothetical protein GCM10022210_50230 [Mucilaginibacter dorajii]|uniref:Uncharacterized protein n=1 Tax=Mucilaginibacter dorajii TaxID=692994 RepID=A0ABP7R0P6_9SPHI
MVTIRRSDEIAEKKFSIKFTYRFTRSISIYTQCVNNRRSCIIGSAHPGHRIDPEAEHAYFISSYKIKYADYGLSLKIAV